MALRIRGFSALAHVGMRKVEQACRQRVRIDIEMPLPEPAGKDGPAVDYDDICAALRALLDSERFVLLEELAQRVAKMLEEDFGAAQFRICCAKPKVHPEVEGIEVELKRG